MVDPPAASLHRAGIARKGRLLEAICHFTGRANRQTYPAQGRQQSCRPRLVGVAAADSLSEVVGLAGVPPAGLQDGSTPWEGPVRQTSLSLLAEVAHRRFENFRGAGQF